MFSHYRSFSIASVVTVILLSLILSATGADPDLFHRLAAGKLAIQLGKVSTTDSFAFTPKLAEWIDHEWLSGVVFYLLYEKFGDDFTESKIYRVRFTELIEYVLEISNFIGKREECTEPHLEQIQAKWVYEWRDNQ